MTKTEIDRRLALAIGYTADRVRMTSVVWKDFYVEVLNDYSRGDGPMEYSGWQRFDHLDPAVIWPIAEQFDAFPQGFKGIWSAYCYDDLRYWNEARCPATASALAVIRYVEVMQ